MRKEDYNVIAPDNKVWNFYLWMENPNMGDNNVSENPYPVMYVEGKPVWEGDKLLFSGDDNGKPHQMMREVKWQHRAIINGNPEWLKLWSWSVNQNKDDRTMDKLIESNKKFDEKNKPKNDDRDSYEGGFDSGMWLSTI